MKKFFNNIKNIVELLGMLLIFVSVIKIIVDFISMGKIDWYADFKIFLTALLGSIIFFVLIGIIELIKNKIFGTKNK